MTPRESLYIKAGLRGFAPYVPGEQPQPSGRLVKLNTNENPYPPSPRVADALRNFDLDALRRYPDPGSNQLREIAASRLGVDPRRVIAGNGSDELLAMILRAFITPGEVVTYPEPTYSLYPVLARMYEAVIDARPAPMGGPKVGAVLDVPAKVTFIASPNAPDGYLVGNSDIEQLCRAREGVGVVVVDEAYVDFSEGGATGLVDRHPNLIVTRTLSKSFSLAGLRVGILAAGDDAIDPLWAVRDSYNLGSLPQALATAAFEDWDAMRENAAKIIATRERTAEELDRRGWNVFPSHANFVFAEPPTGNAAEIYHALAAQEIYVRYFSSPPLDKGLRITIGTDDQMARLFEEVDALG